MHFSTLLTGVLPAALSAAAFWADGSNLGEGTVNPVMLGGAAIFSASRVDGGLGKFVVGFVYIATAALLSVSAHLTSKALGLPDQAELLSPSLTIPAALFAAGICDVILKGRRRPSV